MNRFTPFVEFVQHHVEQYSVIRYHRHQKGSDLMNKNELRAAETKKNLQEAFLQIYTKKEISQITIREITDLAGYNRGTFYLYYHDVYDIFQQVKDDTFQHLSSMADSYFNEQTKLLHEENQNKIFHEITLLIVKAYYEYHATMIPLMLHDITFVESLKQTILPAIQKHLPLAADSQESVWKRDYLLEYHFTAIVSILRLWIKKGQPQPIEEILQFLLEVSFQGPLAILFDQCHKIS